MGRTSVTPKFNVNCNNFSVSFNLQKKCHIKERNRNKPSFEGLFAEIDTIVFKREGMHQLASTEKKITWIMNLLISSFSRIKQSGLISFSSSFFSLTSWLVPFICLHKQFFLLNFMITTIGLRNPFATKK